MLDIFSYFDPISQNDIDSFQASKYSIGKRTIFIDSENKHLLKSKSLCVIGLQEYKKSLHNQFCDSHLTNIRKEFYNLMSSYDINIYDLGNIKIGNNYADSQNAISDTISSLIKQNIIIITIGGSQDLTYSIYKSFSNLELQCNISTLDYRIDFDFESNEFNCETYLNNIFTENPNFLSNYSNIGSQIYHLSEKNIEILTNLNFDNLRIGELSNNIIKAEPLLRNSEIVSVDLNCIRNAECNATTVSNPNGFYADDICQISRYAGFADKLEVFSIFEYDSRKDNNNTTAKLIAQMMWFFLEGFVNRYNEKLNLEENINFKKYTVFNDKIDFPIVFLNSLVSDRWWMKIPLNNKKDLFKTIPCTKSDYLDALSMDLPKIILDTLQKNRNLIK